jgi:hypothetical protein
MTKIVTIDAVEMAQAAGIKPTAFRQRLRVAHFSWHIAGKGWLVVVGSDEHKDMKTVLESMVGDSSQRRQDVFRTVPGALSSKIVETNAPVMQAVPLSAIAPLIEEARRVAVEFYRLTGKPLGITGEVGEFEAARLLNLSLLTARSKDFDAICPAGRRVQIKARMVSPNAQIGGQRVGRIKKTAVFDAVMLVLLDLEYQPWSIWESSHADVMAALNKPGSKSRNERGALGVAAFTRLGREIWKR